MTITHNAIEQGLGVLRDVILAIPEVAEEFTSSHADFGAGSGDAAFDQRYLEWFALERHSPSLKGAPVERLLIAWAERVEADCGLASVVFLSSFTGIFEVSEVRTGEGIWLRDLAGFGEYPLEEPGASHALAAGDLLVGRLYPLPDGRYQVSSGAGVFREPALRAALVRDLKSARASGGSAVIRVAQVDLERMFWGQQTVKRRSTVEMVADAREYMLGAGVAPELVDEVLAELRREPFQSDRLVVGASDILAEILNRLAFETEINLAETRVRLIGVWQALSSPSAAPVAVEPDEDLDAVQRFVDGLQRGGDLETLFATVEEDLALGDLDDSEEDAPAPDFPGVVKAMIAEFEWDLGRERPSEEIKSFGILSVFGEFAKEIGVFEQLTTSDLLRFAAFWLLEQRALTDPKDAHQLMYALSEFCRWAETQHEVEVWTPFEEAARGLSESLPRIVALNQQIERSETLGELFRFENRSGHSVLHDRSGNEHEKIQLASEFATGLADGDYLRGEIDLHGNVAVYCVYPPQAAGLLNA